MAKRNGVHPLVAAATALPLAIGLLAPKPKAPEKPVFHATHKATACAVNLKACPVVGCETEGTPHALVNQMKRLIPNSLNPKALTWDDFATLQQDADSTVGEDQDLDASARARLRNIQVSSGHVSEGDLVQLAGFLVDKPHANTGESVNCDLSGVPNNDFHIPLSNDPDKSGFEGIVVEMIPQNRPPEWNLKLLQRVENERRMVLVAGQLFYDNLHRVRTDPDEPANGQPARFSLFEIHPITSFAVCLDADKQCDPTQATQWETLDKFEQEKQKP